jgi:hypothetical protein
MNEFVIKNGFISQGTSYVSNGNLGIGVTSPTSRLEVKGVDSSSSNYGLKVQNSGGTDNLVVRNDGLITGDGIGGNSFQLGSYSNSIEGNLTIGRVERDSNTTFSIYGANYPTLIFDSVYTTKTSFTSGAGGQYLLLSDTVNPKFTWLSSTNIGINIPNIDSSIDATLKVIGSDSTSSNYGLKVQNSGGTDNLVVRNDGNVGIGTSNPTQKLHILSHGTGGVLAQLNDAPFNVDLSGSYGQLKFTYGSDIEFLINPYPTTFNTSFRFKSNPAGTSGENGIEHSVIGVINGNGGLVIGESLNIGSTSAYTGTYHSGTIYGKRIQKSNFNNPNATFYPLIVMDGNVGIGTLTPSNGKLEVVGGSSQGVIATSTNDIAVNGTSTGASSFGIKGESDLGTSIRSNVTNTSAIGLEVNYTPTNSSLFKVLGDGNVGIGTSTPSEKLDVSGKTKTDSLQIYNPYIPTGSTDPTGSIGDISLSGDILFWRDSTQWYRISGQTW